MYFCLTIDWFYPLFIFGRTVSARKLNKNNGNVLTDFDALLKQQIESFDKGNYGTDNKQVQKHHDLVRMLLMDQDGFLTENNKIDHFIDGNDLYDQVLQDIKNARIHPFRVLYIRSDLGQRILKALEEKLKQGLEVKILYDDVGSKKVKMVILIILNR